MVPKLGPFYRKVERLIGRYHESLASIVADRPKKSAKSLFGFKAGERADADAWAEFIQSILDESDTFFEEAMNVGLDEADSILLEAVPEAVLAKVRAQLEARLAENEKYVRDSLVPDLKAGAYDALGPAAILKFPRKDDETAEAFQGRLDDALDNRVGMYADALYAQANAAMAEPVQTVAGVLINWVLDEGADHCMDCPAIADGGPYADPDADIEGAEPLPTYPGDGDTDCLGKCRCQLEFDEESWNNYADTYEVAS